MAEDVADGGGGVRGQAAQKGQTLGAGGRAGGRITGVERRQEAPVAPGTVGPFQTQPLLAQCLVLGAEPHVVGDLARAVAQRVRRRLEGGERGRWMVPERAERGVIIDLIIVLFRARWKSVWPLIFVWFGNNNKSLKASPFH